MRREYWLLLYLLQNKGKDYQRKMLKQYRMQTKII